MRFRWGPVRSVAATVRAHALPVLVAVLFALPGAALGQWAGWQAAGDLPGADEADAVARMALGGEAPLPERREPRFGPHAPSDWHRRLVAGGNYGPGYVRYTVPADTDELAFRARTKDVRVRLQAAGWHIDRSNVYGLKFVADKGPWRIEYHAGAESFTLSIVRAQPLLVLPLGALGALLGAALGWLFARWIHPRRSGRTRLLAGLSTVAALPLVVVTVLAQVVGYANLARPQIPLWSAVRMPYGWLLLALSIAALVALALVATRGAPRVGRPWSWRKG